MIQNGLSLNSNNYNGIRCVSKGKRHGTNVKTRENVCALCLKAHSCNIQLNGEVKGLCVYECYKWVIYNCTSLLLQAILFVYDITNQSTFDNLEDWWETVRSSFKGKEPNTLPSFALVANKGLSKRALLISYFSSDKFCFALLIQTCEININTF